MSNARIQYTIEIGNIFAEYTVHLSLLLQEISRHFHLLHLVHLH